MIERLKISGLRVETYITNNARNLGAVLDHEKPCRTLPKISSNMAR
jgi:hypothetical protein